MFMGRSAHWDLNNDSRIWGNGGGSKEPTLEDVSSRGGGATIAVVGAEN